MRANTFGGVGALGNEVSPILPSNSPLGLKTHFTSRYSWQHQPASENL
jgi:hypothetical protein